MRKSKGNKILISILSISAMLTLGLTTPTLIQEFSPTKENSNISAGERSSSTITQYEQTGKSQSGNSVQYSFAYAEDDVWFWDQEKSDFNAPTWRQTTYESYHYGSYHSSASSTSDLPKVTVTYNKPRPTHEEWRNGSDGHLGYEHGGSNWYQDIPEDEDDPNWDAYQKWKHYGDDDYKVTVDDPYPIPSSYYSNWKRQESASSSRNTYTYIWQSEYSKMTSYPNLGKDWTLSNKSAGNWQQREPNKWDWSSQHGYWSSPDRELTGKGNQSVWIDWTLSSQGNIEQLGKRNISTKDDYVSNNINSGSDIYFIATENDKLSSKPPAVYIPEPKDGPESGVSGNTTININNLALGWEYTFDAELKYKDQYGSERIYDTYQDSFKLEKQAPSLNVELDNVNSTTLSGGYEISDKHGTRVSDVSWVLDDSAGTSIYSGSSKAENNKFYFDGLDSTEKYTFTAEYDYVLSTNDNGTVTKEHISQTTTPVSPVGEYYENVGVVKDVWVSNVQSDTFVINTYLDTNNNLVNEDWEMYYTSVDGRRFDIPTMKPGTNSTRIDLTDLPNNPELTLNVSGTGLSIEDGIDISVSPEKTNMSTVFDIFSLEGVYTNREASIKYYIEDSKEDIDTFQYTIDNKNWIDLDSSFFTPGTHYLELEDLTPETEYTLTFRGYEPIDGYYIYSNNFRFKTDRDTSISNFELSSTEDTVTFGVELDKIEWLDDRNIYWEIKDINEKKVVQNGKLEVKTNGLKSFTITDLNPDTEYEVTLNLFHDNITNAEWGKVRTSSNGDIDKLNNAKITDVTRNKDKSFNIYYEGTFKYVSYYDESSELFVRLSDDYKIGSTSVKVNPHVDQDSYTFILNDSVNTAYTWYAGIDSTLSHPKDPFEFNLFLFIIMFSILFIIITIVIVSIWAYFWRKRKNNPKVNIWEVDAK